MIYSSWDIEPNILKLVILGYFLPFKTPKSPKNQNFETWKNLLEMSSFYTCVTKITIIRYKVPEYRVRLTEFFVILGHFLPFYHPANDPQNQNFEEKKWKKPPGDITLLYIHVCHKWRSHDIWLLKYKIIWYIGPQI